MEDIYYVKNKKRATGTSGSRSIYNLSDSGKKLLNEGGYKKRFDLGLEEKNNYKLNI